MSWRNRRRDRRRAEAWNRLLAAIKAHPEAPMAVIQRCSGLRWSRLYVALAELEKVGLVISYWRVRPLPKRKLYRLAESPRNPIE